MMTIVQLADTLHMYTEPSTNLIIDLTVGKDTNLSFRTLSLKLNT